MVEDAESDDTPEKPGGDADDGEVEGGAPESPAADTGSDDSPEPGPNPEGGVEREGGLTPGGPVDPDEFGEPDFVTDSEGIDKPDPDDEGEATASDGGETGSGNIYPDREITQDTHVLPEEDDWDDDDDDDFWGQGAPDDQEMPLADHIEEMVRRLGIVVIVMALVSGLVFPFGDQLINFLWYSILPGAENARPHVYHPLALILARLKVATLAGFIIALPVFVYETYLFMRPGLYPTERRYYLASVPTSLVLATVGVLFAYALVLPALFTYFLYYSDDVTVIAFGLTETFDLIVLMMGGFALIFQIPLFVMLAIMMGLTTRQWMADRRLYFWGAFLGIAFLFSPDPTGMAPILVALTMVSLFEGTLLLLKWTGR
jgi:sec-independent protein translocase protein TatC